MRRYLFPPISKIALLSPTKSTLAPNAFFRSAGELQFPLETIWYQVLRGFSASGYRSQKSLSTFLAITFIAIACSQYGIKLKIPKLGTVKYWLLSQTFNEFRLRIRLWVVFFTPAEETASEAG